MTNPPKDIRSSKQAQLANSEEDVALGKSHIREQEERLSMLTREGHDTRLAQDLLATFKETQALHEQHRDVIKDEIAAAKRGA